MATNGNPRPAWVQGTLRALRFSFRVVREGLIHTGYAYWMMPPDYFSARNAYRAKSEGWDADQIARSDRWSQPERTGPALRAEAADLPEWPEPPEHPERLVRDQPLTPQEARLWAELLEPDETDRGRNVE